MVRLFSFLLVGLALVVSTLHAQGDPITFIHVGDSHSRLAPSAPRNTQLEGTIGGIARLATAVGMIRGDAPDAIALHSGDFSIGDLFYNKYFGVAELQILSQLGFDAVTLGNHEFDLTPPTLKTAIEMGVVGSPMTFLAANLLNVPDSIARNISACMVIPSGSHRVGVFGMITEETNTLSQPAPIRVCNDYVAAATMMVDSLKRLGCDVIVMLSHLGLRSDRQVINGVSGINLVLGGHDHFTLTDSMLAPDGKPVYIVHSGAWYETVSVVRMAIVEGQVRLVSNNRLELTTAIPEAPSVKAVVADLTAAVETTYGPLYTQQIATAAEDIVEEATDLTSTGWHDTPAGNLICDAFRAAAGTDMAMQAGGSIADILHAGPIVPADVFRLMGYGFNTVNGLGYRVVKITMPGLSIMKGLEFGLSAIEASDEFLIQVSGIRYMYDPTRAIGSRLVGVTLDGVPLAPDSSYTVAANEFVLAFLNLMQIPFTSHEYLPEALTEFQVVNAAIAALGTVRAVVDGRVSAGVGGVRPTVAPPPARLTVTFDRGGQATAVLDVDRPGDATLTLCDALGRPMSRLFASRVADGRIAVPIETSVLPQGVYFVLAETGGARTIATLHVVR